MKQNNSAIYVTFVMIGLAIWIDSLWIKIPMTIWIIITAWLITKGNQDGVA